MPGTVTNRTPPHEHIVSPSGGLSDWPTAQWVWDSATAQSLVASAVPGKYWNLSGDIFTEMTQPEKDAVDAQELSAQRDTTSARLDEIEDIVRAFVLTLLDERNRMAQAFNDLKNGIATANNLNDAKTAAALISDEPIRTVAQIKNGIRNKLGL